MLSVPASAPVGSGKGVHDLQGLQIAFASADADDTIDGGDPDLPVADLSGTGSVGDGVDDLVGVAAVAQHLDADLREEVDGVLRAPIGLGVAALAADALDLVDRDPLDPDAWSASFTSSSLNGLITAVTR